MIETVTNELNYSVPQKMQADMSELKFGMRDLKVRMTTVKEPIGGSLIAMSGVDSRLDRIERIERRLDLTDAH